MSLSKVSIIIPSFNSKELIKQTLDSVVCQTYKNIEIIVIDDGSTDGSFEFLQSVQQHYSLVLKRNKGKGACAARNYGFELATGVYIQFLDADDLLSSDKIEKQINELQSAEYNAVASCGWIHFITQPDRNNYIPQKIDNSYATPIDWLINSWNEGEMGQTGVWLIPRELILKAGFWNESLLKNQDGEFMARVLCHASSIVFVKDAFAYYRKPALTNISQIKSEEATTSVLQSYKLYEIVLNFKDNQDVRMALAKNYNNFIYINFNTFPNLAKKAEEYVLKLGQDVNIPFTNKFLNILGKIFGFKVIMRVRRKVKGY